METNPLKKTVDINIYGKNVSVQPGKKSFAAIIEQFHLDPGTEKLNVRPAAEPVVVMGKDDHYMFVGGESVEAA